MYYKGKKKPKTKKSNILRKIYQLYHLTYFCVHFYRSCKKNICSKGILANKGKSTNLEKKKKSEVSKEETFKENILFIWSIYTLQTVTTCIIFGHDDDQGEYF